MPDIIGVKIIDSQAPKSQDISTDKEIKKANAQAHEIIKTLQDIGHISSGNVLTLISGTSLSKETFATAILDDLTGKKEGAIKITLKERINKESSEEIGDIEINSKSITALNSFLDTFKQETEKRQAKLANENTKEQAKSELKDIFRKGINKIATNSERTEIETPKGIPAKRQAAKKEAI